MNLDPGNWNLNFFTIDSTYLGNETNSGAWTFRDSITGLTSAGTNNPTSWDITDFYLPGGGEGFYIFVTNGTAMKLYQRNVRRRFGGQRRESADFSGDRQCRCVWRPVSAPDLEWVHYLRGGSRTGIACHGHGIACPVFCSRSAMPASPILAVSSGKVFRTRLTPRTTTTG